MPNLSEAQAKAIVDRIFARLRREAPGHILLAIAPEGSPTGHFRSLANAGGLAAMLHRLIAAQLEHPRPTDCDACAAAWDALQAAELALRPTTGTSCN